MGPDPTLSFLGICSSCHFDKGWVCDACTDDEYMPSPSGDRCVKKIENCIIDTYEQPMDAFGVHTLDQDLVLNRWICPGCIDGFYFNEDSAPGEQTYCEPCLIENCLDCELHFDKCVECAEDFIPNYRGDACIEPIEFCETNPLNYDHNGDVWICPKCLLGYFPLDDTCQECTLDPNCASCSDNTECLECNSPMILNEDQSGCIDLIENCEDLSEDYVIDETTGRFRCEKCSNSMTWEFNLEAVKPWQCNVCSDVYPDC